jgi:hypothetical protein
MLAPPETRRCIQCGASFDSPAFWYHQGDPANGPAYWTDRGILCSPTCSLSHFQMRQAQGTLPTKPAPDPFEFDFLARSDT